MLTWFENELLVIVPAFEKDGKFSFLPSLQSAYIVRGIGKRRNNKMGRNNSRRRSSLAEDAAALAAMGHRQELQRNFSMLSMLGLAFAILNSWTALSASLSLALPSGGPTSVIWGLVTAGICNLCLAASLAEFLSAYVVYPKLVLRSWRIT